MSVPRFRVGTARPVWSLWRVQCPSESHLQLVLCFRCGCGGTVAGWCAVDGLVKGVGVVWWDAVLVSISVKGRVL